MRPSKYFYDKPLPKYLDLKTVLIYRPHPVNMNTCKIKPHISIYKQHCTMYIHIFSSVREFQKSSILGVLGV
jgi:hypothetical protein